MKNANNQQQKRRRDFIDIIAIAAVIIGAIAAYIGFVFDITGMLAAGSLAATLGTCNFMIPTKI